MTRTSEEFREAILDLLQAMRWDTPTLLEDYLRNHLTREGALVYGLEHCVFAANFPRWLANITGNCPHLKSISPNSTATRSMRSMRASDSSAS